MPSASPRRRRDLLRTLLATLALAAVAGGSAGCTPSLSDSARAEQTPDAAAVSPFESQTCEAVRAGIAAYNAGDLPRSLSAFADALPLARARVQRLSGSDGSVEARQLLEAVEYYAGLSEQQLADAFPASPETQQYQDTTLSQCQPLPPGLEDPETDDSEQAA